MEGKKWSLIGKNSILFKESAFSGYHYSDAESNTVTFLWKIFYKWVLIETFIEGTKLVVLNSYKFGNNCENSKERAVFAFFETWRVEDNMTFP